MLDTGALTEHVISKLDLLSWLEVGDGIAPVSGGWSKGQQDVDQFVPYAVVAFMGARPRTPELSLSKTEDAWLAQYQLRYHAASRAQADWTGTSARRAVDELLKTEITSDNVIHQISWVEWQSLGGVTRNDSTDPPIWAVIDSLTLHVVKRGT